MRNKLLFYIFVLMMILTIDLFANESPQATENINLFVDQIYLANGKILKGKVILVGKDKVEYMPDGKIKSNYIVKSQIIKIVYENKEEIVINPALNINNVKKVTANNIYDMIYLKNNTIKFGKILKVGDIHVEYNPAGEHPFDVCVRKDVEKIVYKDGKEVYFTKGKFVNNNNLLSAKELKNNFPRIMLKTYMMLGGSYGNFSSAEEDILDNYENDKDDWDYSKDNLRYNEYAFGLELDLSIFIFKPFILGVKGRFEKKLLTQTFTDTNIQHLYSHYNNVLLGPNLSIFIVNFSDNLSLFVQNYFLYGKIINGKYRAAEGLRDEQDFDGEEYHAEISKGHVYQVGAGPLILFNNSSLPIAFGTNLYYSKSKIYFKEILQAYNKKEITMHNVGMELFIGIYF